MSRIAIPSRDDAPAAAKPVLDAVYKLLGFVPNLYRLLALSPAALEGFATHNAALGKTLDAKTRERLAIAIAAENGCAYCETAHSYIALNLVKLSADEIARARQGTSSDAKADAALRFAVKVANARGHVDAGDVDAVRAAGFGDGEIVAIVSQVALSTLTNYLNEVAKTEIDFPAAPLAA